MYTHHFLVQEGKDCNSDPCLLLTLLWVKMESISPKRKSIFQLRGKMILGPAKEVTQTTQVYEGSHHFSLFILR